MSSKTTTERICAGDCGRPLRFKSEKLADFPGTVSEWSGGYCSHCLAIKKRRDRMPAPVDRVFTDDEVKVRRMCDRRFVGDEHAQVIGALGLAS